MILRVGQKSDVGLVRRCLYLALAWKPGREIPAEPTVLAHPDVAIYHEGWGRPGDLLVVADIEREPVGYAFARLFTSDRHGHGFVDQATPEMGIAVEPHHRGHGVGTSLLRRLHQELAEAGRQAVSLSVEAGNPAVNLYRREGYEDVAADAGGLVMRKLLGTG